MSLTRIDCSFFSSDAEAPLQFEGWDQAVSAEATSFVALNPSKTPGSLVAAGSSALRGSIGSQVACKLATHHFVDGILSYFDQKRSGEQEVTQDKELSQELLERAFRNANSSVYSFAHKLSAGGRMSATLIGVVIEDNIVAAGRVGPGSAYLLRDGELCPFFEAAKVQNQSHLAENCIGAHSLVSVELASAPIRESDVLVMFSGFLTSEEEQIAQGVLGSRKTVPGRRAFELAQSLYAESRKALSYILVAEVGPETIFLSDPLAA